MTPKEESTSCKVVTEWTNKRLNMVTITLIFHVENQRI